MSCHGNGLVTEETQSKTAGGVRFERSWGDFMVTGLYSASGFAYIL